MIEKLRMMTMTMRRMTAKTRIVVAITSKKH